MPLAGRTIVTTVGEPVPISQPGITGQVIVQAETDNTGYIAIGGAPNVKLPSNRFANGPRATETQQEGFILNAGEAYPEALNLNETYIDASVAGDGVTWFMPES